MFVRVVQSLIFCNRYWIYWVPSQYVKAIKDLILGQW